MIIIVVVVVVVVIIRRVGSVVRALEWRSKSRGFESRQEHKKNLSFSESKKVALTRCRCAQPPCIRTHTKDRVLTLNILM